MTTTTPTPEQVRAAWDALAPGFDEHVTPQNEQLGAELVGRVDVRSGTRFLDVAAGSGALALAAARRGADVLATDVAPAMIERLRDRASAAGLTNVRAQVMDGESLDLDDDSFDVTGSQNGVSLFPGLDAGLAEMVRVTRPGGRVLVAAIGAPQRAEFFTYFIGAVRAAAPEAPVPPSDPPPLPFQLADPEVFRHRLVDAGLVDVTVQPATWELRFESAAGFWAMVTSSNPLGAQVAAALTSEQRDEALRVVDGMLRERSGGEPAALLRAEVNVGIGATR
ncbi:ubiquinone/menaquinone biosynthesis C-methylase UbiE [Haloactinopolyspora alba]|uniref:Ubiquinone/menaquinone biosynthesis C-methylase UbiE n=1 Tax=Haloactinopolyspora alba TaxID=648780 RepID=A0A2P8E5Q7_9ACTN|nr:class I SAM-dependent methyltransferase [Haloactinopolyspora alba]PSL04799.1 ubiquinone/menaquinone biosynthesis C-methylase UbiE [Haloactinopolyspora alba]